MTEAIVDQRRRLSTIALCFLVAILEGYDIQAIGVAAPRLAPALGILPDQLGLIFSISNIGLVLGASVGGWIADRVGRRPVLVGAVVTFGLFTLATLFVQDFRELFGVRFLTGLGLGAALPNMMALAADISAPEKRGSTTTMMFCGMPLGGAGSAYFVSMLDQGDWKTVFLVGGVLPLVIAPLLQFFLVNVRPIASTAAGVRTNVVSALFGEGRAIPTLLLWAIYLPTLLILYLLLNWLPTLTVANGMDRTVAPQVSLAFNIGGFIGALVLGRVIDRFGFRWPATAAYLVLILSMFAMAQAHEPTQALIFATIMGLALLGAQYGLYGVAASYYPSVVRGVGSGFIVAIGRVGSIIGPYLAGVWLAGGQSAGQVISSLVPFAVVSVIATVVVSFFPYAKESK